MEFFSFFLPMLIVLTETDKERKAAEDKDRERRMAEHRMNARLLRFDI